MSVVPEARSRSKAWTSGAAKTWLEWEVYGKNETPGPMDYNLDKHPEVEEASNLEVIKLMTSLTSKDLVSCRFSWKHYYWFLTDDGIEYLRED